MVNVSCAFAETTTRVQTEWQLGTVGRSRSIGWIGLREGAQRPYRMILKSSNTFVRAKVMIERTILLHEEYNVFNGAQVGPGRPCDRRFFDSAIFGAPLGQESAPESQAAAKKLPAIKR